MNKEEILKAMYDIQCRYTMSYIKRNFTDKDYIILNYENLVIQIANKQDELGKKMFANTTRENKQLKEQLDKYKYIVEEIKKSCRSVIGNLENTIVSKNKLMKILLKEIEDLENEE